MEAPRARRVAQNEAAARRNNESIHDERAGKGERGPRWLICECARADCAELLDVGADKYHEVRADPHRFIVQHGHEELDYELIVERTTQYLVVEKTGEGARVAEE